MKKTILAISLVAPFVQASDKMSVFQENPALANSDPLFTDDYKALQLCTKLSAEKHQERFENISNELAKIDPIYHSNLENFKLRAQQFSQLDKSVIGEYEILCNRFAKSSQHIDDHDLAENIFYNREFLVSTSFALLIQELKLNNKLNEAKETIELYAEHKIPHAMIIKAGYLLEEGKTKEAIRLAKKVAEEGLAIAHITLSAIYEELGDNVSAYAWLYVGLDGVVRAHSSLFDKLAYQEKQLTEEDVIHSMLLRDEIKKKYPVKTIAH